MSLFDSASLVVTPNGTKASKLYAIKPTDGSGDLVVTRATTATRVNSAGLVELVPYNLLQYSEQFDNAYWSTQDATITANTTTAPNGTLTADTFTRTANTAFLYATNPFSLITGSYSISVYAKANTTSSFRLDLASSGLSQGVTCTFNLSTATAGTPILYGSASSFVAAIENVGNGWYRCSLSGNLISANYYAELAITTTGSIYIWGAQLVTGTSAKEYFPTTDRLDVPRLDYTNSSCPSILVEPQRTNLVTYSEQFDNGAWVKDNVSISANSVTSPSGIQNADSILETATTSTHTTYNRASMTSGQAYTQSCYFKANGRNRVIMQIFDNATQYANAIFDLSSGVVVASFGTATIQNMTNGWYRCTITGTSPATGLGYCVIGLCENTYSTPSVFPTYLGDITKGVYAWGFQVEQGSYPTSYIPTVASSVTRNADVISKTGISSLIGQTEGTYFIDVNLTTRNNFTLSFIRNSDISSYIGFNVFQSVIYAEVVNTTVQAQIAFNNSSTGRFKLLVTYKNNEFKFYANGTLIGTDTSGSVPSCSVLDLYYNFTGNALYYNSVQLYKTVLTNAECIALTTL